MIIAGDNFQCLYVGTFDKVQSLKLLGALGIAIPTSIGTTRIIRLAVGYTDEHKYP
ncbi:hypothetical protein [Nodularia sphaerocarpa]|uniref:hypothetical protein n=1 Tax=Nodularia sphaerocarpa TaxID=137816 RepID=UPI001EFBD0BB|nr:hypothetical protein [Nodularia sphaerocarpa]ULP71728.1 hypothetical protein BDGGKGIB_01361 [Nodularia sphaerocarpa UHCC 0038]